MKKLFYFLLLVPCLCYTQTVDKQNKNIQIQNTNGIAFTRGPQSLGDFRTFGVAIEDFDMDGDNDVITTNYIGASKLWLNNGNADFTESDQVFNIQEVHDIQVADLNGDNYPDVFLLSHENPSKVFFNNGSGVFTPGQQNIGSPEEAPGSMVLGDVDMDGDLDAFIQYWRLPNRLWLNDGNGVFTITGTMYGDSINSGRLVLEDFNNDTYPDLFLCQVDQSDEVWLNDGNGHYAKSNQTLGSNLEGHEDVNSGDVDGDGDIDVIVINSSLGVKIWLNQNNTGIFNEAGDYFGEGGIRCELFDAEQDGDLDLITSHNNGIFLWLNDGNGNYSSLGAIFGNSRGLSLKSGDLDSDNDLDLIFGMGEGSGGNPIYFNESIQLGINDNNNLKNHDIKLNNYPNPFNSTTTISYHIPFQSFVSLKLFDSLGKYIITMVENGETKGTHQIEFDSNNLSEGIYYYQLTTPDFSKTSKMIISN